MLRQDFQDWNIRHFTPEEIEATGADLKKVQVVLVAAMDRFREILGRPFKLIKDGMTTGHHKAPEHAAGLAVDGFVPGLDGVADPITAEDVLKAALKAGFHGIGVYWNGGIYSFHFDLRPDFSFWTGTKSPSVPGWNYGKLINDPREAKNGTH